MGYVCLKKLINISPADGIALSNIPIHHQHLRIPRLGCSVAQVCQIPTRPAARKFHGSERLIRSTIMEAATKTFFSSPRFAVVGASQSPHKFGYKGKLARFNRIHFSLHTYLTGVCSPSLVSRTLPAGAACHSFPPQYSNIFHHLPYCRVALCSSFSNGNFPQRYHSAISNSPGPS